MIKLASTTITINAPTDTVFLYVSNMENYKHWFPGVVDIRSADNMPPGVVGKRYSETLLLPNGESLLNIEVDRCERPVVFLTKGDLEGILPQMTVLFSENQLGMCEVNLSYHSRSNSLTEGDDVIKLLRGDLEVKAKEGLKTLKGLLE